MSERTEDGKQATDSEPGARSMIPELLTERELCDLLRISPATAWRLRKAKKLGYCRVGVRILYLRRHIVAFLDAHEVQSS